MDADLIKLEDKIKKLIGLCSDLRAENSGLRDDLSAAHTSTDALKTKMSLASEKLAGLLAAMPDSIADDINVMGQEAS